MITGVAAGSPSSKAVASVATSSGENPEWAAVSGSIVKIVAGPLMVLSMPFRRSTTPFTLLTASAILGAQFCSCDPSLENNLMNTSSGSLERSPIISCKTCTNSTSIPGSSRAMRERNSETTSSVPRLRSDFNFTAMSPRFTSVTAARPSSSPVRREAPCTSGISRIIVSMCPTTRLVSASEFLPGSNNRR